MNLTTGQRRHLQAAADDECRLHRLTRRPNHLTGYDWQRAAALASSVAGHVEQVAVLAEHRDAAEFWHRCASVVHDRAARCELWAALADAFTDIGREES